LWNLFLQKTYLQDEKVKLELALVDAARVMQGGHHALLDADLVLERLHKAAEVASVLQVLPENINRPIK
jgi:hypothetical protein